MILKEISKFEFLIPNKNKQMVEKRQQKKTAKDGGQGIVNAP